MATKHERTCLMCGEKYNYCSHCNEYKDQPKWKFLYHDENCKEVADIWHQYRGNELTKEQAKAKLAKHNLTKILKYPSMAVDEIKAIVDDKKTVKAEPKKVVVKKDEPPKGDATVVVNK